MDALDVAADGPRRLDPRVVAVWRGKVLWNAVVAAVVVWPFQAMIHLYGGPRKGVLSVAILVLGAVAAWCLPPVNYRRWTYAVGDSAVELCHGVVVRRRKAIPYFRVQHIDISQGPIDRRLGLHELVIHTASAASRAKLPGLMAADAQALRKLLLRRSGVVDGV